MSPGRAATADGDFLRGNAGDFGDWHAVLGCFTICLSHISGECYHGIPFCFGFFHRGCGCAATLRSHRRACDSGCLRITTATVEILGEAMVSIGWDSVSVLFVDFISLFADWPRDWGTVAGCNVCSAPDDSGRRAGTPVAGSDGQLDRSGTQRADAGCASFRSTIYGRYCWITRI